MNMRPKCSFGRGKTLTDAGRSVLVGVQELLPSCGAAKAPACVHLRPILLLFTGVWFCFMSSSG